MSNNLQLAKIFSNMALFLEMQEDKFRARAYARAAQLLQTINKDVSDIYDQQGAAGLDNLPGIGENITKKILEFIFHGRVNAYEKLKKQCPIKIEELNLVEGLGPKKIKKLYQELNIRDLKTLEKALRAGQVAQLAGMGVKIQANLLKAVKFLKIDKGRILLADMLVLADELIQELKKVEGVRKIVAAGSLRRRQETIGDLDLLAVTSQPSLLITALVDLPGVIKIWAQGGNKASVHLSQGFDADLRLTDKKSFGAALQYFTGNKEHNVAVRQLAKAKGYKLNEYGLFKKNKIIAVAEKEIYQKLGLDFILPELRTNQGEIEAAAQHNLPAVIKLKDIKGDLQMHSTWSDGDNSLKEMTEYAKKLGHQYIAITDHAGKLRVANALDEKRIKQQRRAINRVNQKLLKTGHKIRVLHGAEVDILKDGQLALPDSVLQELDIVVASIHDNFKMPKKAMTARIIRAMQNPFVNSIGHPTGRVLLRRPGYEIDLGKIAQAAQEFNCALEINAFPTRLDLSGEMVKQAKQYGIKFSIGTDAHQKEHLSYFNLGVYMARRGWLESKDVINTMNLKELLAWIKSKRL